MTDVQKATDLSLSLKEDVSCVVTLDVDFDDLMAPPQLQTEGRTRLRTENGAPQSIAFESLSFEVRYARSPAARGTRYSPFKKAERGVKEQL